VLKKPLWLVLWTSIMLFSCQPNAVIEGSVITLKSSPYKKANYIIMSMLVLPESQLPTLRRNLKEGLETADAHGEALVKYGSINLVSQDYDRKDKIVLNVATGEISIGGKEVPHFDLNMHGFDYKAKRVSEHGVGMFMSDAVVGDKVAVVWLLASGDKSDPTHGHLHYIAQVIQKNSIYTVTAE
jgi:hypothetical protein